MWPSPLKTKNQQSNNHDYVPLTHTAYGLDQEHRDLEQEHEDDRDGVTNDDVLREEVWEGIERELGTRTRSPLFTARNALFALLIIVVCSFPFVLMSNAAPMNKAGMAGKDGTDGHV